MVKKDLGVGVDTKPAAAGLQTTKHLADAVRGDAVRLPAAGRRTRPHVLDLDRGCLRTR